MPYTAGFAGSPVSVLTIRRTLLAAFLLAGLLPSALLAWLAFRFASDALHLEIEQSLKVEAAAISQDIDKMLFERLQNAQTWSRLEVMQELKVDDVDKRIANFLAELKAGYRDVYSELICANLDGKVVASSNSQAVGTQLAEDDGTSLSFAGDAAIALRSLRFGDRQTSAVLPIDVRVQSIFDNTPIGQLQLHFNWAQIYQILDQAERGSRSVLVVDRDGKVIDGKLRPSSDMPTHVELYRHFPTIGGIVHTHSTWATVWAQACRGIPAFGTTHADYFYGEIPCTRILTEQQTSGHYEADTGLAIVERFREGKIDPKNMPVVLVANHGPFAWGGDANDAVHNAAVLELTARMALLSLQLEKNLPPMPQHLLEKHFFRKHGPGAYYGQN